VTDDSSYGKWKGRKLLFFSCGMNRKETEVGRLYGAISQKTTILKTCVLTEFLIKKFFLLATECFHSTLM
jgi:hypothetical protein